MKNYNDKLARIKALIMDVDGVLTDGMIQLAEDGIERRNYNVKDGIGIRLAQRAQIKLVIMTTSSSKGIKVRGKRLDIDIVSTGVKDKTSEFKKIVKKLKLENSQVAYVGDDLVDIGPMQLAGVSFAVADAVLTVKKVATFTTKTKGGQGAIREICELLVKQSKPKLFREINQCGLSL